ncbi:MAG: hypothetical protein ABIQ74_00510 [Chitinophagales bacterium]
MLKRVQKGEKLMPSLNEEAIKKLEQEFVDNAIIHGQCTLNGDYKKGNKAYDKISKVKKKLYSYGEECYVNSLLRILVHDDAAVKQFASGNLLPFEPEIAREVLKELSKLPNLIGFSSEMALREWDKGKLNPIPK